MNTGNALVTLIPLDGQFSGEISTFCDGNGDYEAVVHENYYGHFDVKYSKVGYITDYVRNIEITTVNQSLTITQDFTLLPITDSTYVYVSNDENIPAFRNIQDAVEYLSAHNSGTINIFPGTYTGERNKNITWWPYYHITIIGVGIGEHIIDCGGNEIAFNFSDESGYYQYNENDRIENLTIQNAHQGIVIEQGSPVIKNNTIENCAIPAYSDQHGAGICCKSSATIENNTIINNVGNWIFDHLTYGGGIYVENNTSNTALIKNNIVSGNSAYNGGGIYCTGSGNIILDGNEITENTLVAGSNFPYPEDGTGIYCYNCADLEVRNNVICENISYPPNSSGLAFSSINCDDVIIENNTIVSNENQTGIKLKTYSPAIINNNIVSNNKYGISKVSLESPIITYCCISNNSSGNYNGLPSGIGCLGDVDSELDEETYQPFWISDAKSPCIDVGNPALSLDPDGTPADIGAIRAINHKIETIELIDTSDGINWKCFPVLDDIYAEEDIAANVLYDIMQPPMPAALELVETQGGNNNIYFVEPYWVHADQEFISVKGYKLIMNEVATLEITGFLENPEQTINLVAGGENWIGYFPEESMEPFDALAAVLDKINRITTRTFTYIKLADNSWLGVGDLPRDPTLNYGDLVIVSCTESCSFFWGQDGGGTVPKDIRSTSQDFTYTEEADYIPVFVELDLEALDNPTEIGIFVENECKGAEVIEDSLVQIRAYVFNDSMIFDPGIVEFQLSYGSRSENRLINSYSIKESPDDTGNIEQLDFTQTQNSYYLISLNEPENNVPEIAKTSLDQNYPNPFNPSTTIAYSIQNDGLIELKVYNIKGQLVKTLVKGEQQTGSYEVVWNGKDSNEKSISSGVYFYKLSTKDETIMKKMLMLK